MISPIDTILVKRTYSVSIAKRVDVQESKRLLAVPQLHGWDLSCIVVSHWTLQVRCTALPLMILQKIHEAAILSYAVVNNQRVVVVDSAGQVIKTIR